MCRPQVRAGWVLSKYGAESSSTVPDTFQAITFLPTAFIPFQSLLGIREASF